MKMDEETEIVTLGDVSEITDAKTYPLPSDKPMGYTWTQIDHLEIGPRGVLMVPKGSKLTSPYAYPDIKGSIENLIKEIEELKKKKKKKEEEVCPKVEDEEKEELQKKLEAIEKEYNDYKTKIENTEKEKLMSEVQMKAKTMGFENFEEKLKDADINKLQTIKETIESVPTPKTKDFGKGAVATSSEISEDELLKMAGL